ncbi:hypothetical protein F4808DRAFT_414604 [Astrocystis sublimbata]|nr:hypothetical protein F4808DRAFT_414604 [Astrocystis sublimbata]
MASASQTTDLQPTEADSWTKVRRGKGRRPASNAPTELLSNGTVSPPALSLDQVKQEHARYAAEWKSSPAHAKLLELLSAHVAGRGSSVTKAVCFGLGSVNPPGNEWHWKRNSHTQLVAFLAIIEFLQKTSGHQIRCLFQEPRFNSTDKAFITSLGHEVVETPTGFQVVDPETLVYGIHVYGTICAQMVATCIPAAYIGTPYRAWEDSWDFNKCEHEGMARLKGLSTSTITFDFPENKGDTVFGSTIVHWQKGPGC